MRFRLTSILCAPIWQIKYHIKSYVDSCIMIQILYLTGKVRVQQREEQTTNVFLYCSKSDCLWACKDCEMPMSHTGIMASIAIQLAARKQPYSDQATFFVTAWPFALKLLWAPVVDAFYWRRLGRRKSWCVHFLHTILTFVAYNVRILLIFALRSTFITLHARFAFLFMFIIYYITYEQRWQKMLVKLWVKNDIFNILGVKEDQCKKLFLMFSPTFFNISPFFDEF